MNVTYHTLDLSLVPSDKFVAVCRAYEGRQSAWNDDPEDVHLSYFITSQTDLRKTIITKEFASYLANIFPEYPIKTHSEEIVLSWYTDIDRMDNVRLLYVYVKNENLELNSDTYRYKLRQQNSYLAKFSLSTRWKIHLSTSYLLDNHSIRNSKIIENCSKEAHAKIETKINHHLRQGSLKACSVCDSIFNPKMNLHDELCITCSLEFSKCEHCNRWYNTRYCTRCYAQCEICQEWLRAENLYRVQSEYINHYLCLECRETRLRQECDLCGESFYAWDISNHIRRCGEWVIHSYSYKPLPTFYKHNQERIKRYFGLEIESECLEGDPEDVLSDINSELGKSPLKKWIYPKDDGSLNNGIEWVTHPMTRAFIEKEFIPQWREFSIQLTRTYNFRAHDTSTCGLHIHVSRDSCDLKTWAKFSAFWNTQPMIDKVCRRGSSHYCEKKYINSSDTGFLTHSSDRYEAVNFENNNTVEVRQFRGTLNPDTLLASVEFIDEVLHFIKPHSVSILRFNDMTTQFQDYIKTRGSNYPLISYLTAILARGQ